MDFANLTSAELREMLMEKTKLLTTAIRDGAPPGQREEMRQQIEAILQLLVSAPEKKR